MNWLLKNRILVDIRVRPILFQMVSGWDNASGRLGLEVLNFGMAQQKLITLLSLDVWIIQIALHISW